MPALSPLKSALQFGAHAASGAAARLRLRTGRPVRFSGVFASRQAALNSLPSDQRGAYDRDDVTDVSYEAMTRIVLWDYPVIHWLARCQAAADHPLRVLDAGGHMGTKYTAFAPHLPVDDMEWTVWDVPAIVRAGRQRLEAGALPAALRFAETPAEPGEVDVLLASGLMQYLDGGLSDLVAQLAAPPRWIVLNKVALRSEGALVTLEQIGPALVPYQIRDARAWTADLEQVPYTLRDSWQIPSLSHRITTHPWLTPGQSWGYVLERD